MKKKYSKTELDIMVFDTEDIIVTSGEEEKEFDED